MKYRVLLKFLRILVYGKRLFWWLGAKLSFIFAKVFGSVTHPFIYVHYKASYFLKRIFGGKTREWFFKRDFLQIVILLILILAGISQTTLVRRRNLYLAGQRTIAYAMVSDGEEILEEVVTESRSAKEYESAAWREGLLDDEMQSGIGQIYLQNTDLGSVVAGGSALSKPTIIPGASLGAARTDVVEYTVEPGDSLGGIAYQYGISIDTLLWENNLTVNSIIRPGLTLRVPPATGIMYTIKKGDTLGKVALAYQAKAEEIVSFNNLKEDGTDLIVGERIMVPNGVPPRARPIASVGSRVGVGSKSRLPAPPGSKTAPTRAGYVWPSGSRIITQYFNWRHNGLDIAGPFHTPIYAIRAGTVELAKCGWNGGYGCYTIVNHGDGIKSLYGHNDQLLVSVGDKVATGQSIALMGKTGNVRGRTGIHVHFEVIVNGIRVNPLGYVR